MRTHFAVEYLLENDTAFTVNLGTGIGISVLDLVHAFQDATNRKVPYNIVARRPGDVASYFANPSAAEKLFGWKASLDVKDMCRDAWTWEAKRVGINDV